MTYTIRPYEDRDLDAVLTSWESASKVAHPFLTEEFLNQERYNIPNIYLPNAETWVVEKEENVVGFIALIGNEVGAIFIRSEYHGKGAGSALMDKAKALRKELEVDVFKKNAIGRSFYAHAGFSFLSERLHEETGNTLIRLKFSNS